MSLKIKLLSWMICISAGLYPATAAAQNSPAEMTDEQALAYIASYPDLIASFGTNTVAAREHYFNSGKAEGRQISFKPLQYIASYSDLIGVFGLDTETATRQYIRSGRAQGRLLTFDGLRYIASNISYLRPYGTDVDAAARHYISTGYAAGWKTQSFSVLDYIASYGDLIYAFGQNVIQAVTHYITTGFDEQRAVTFNPGQYLANYSDLRSAFGSDTKAATGHFISNGYAEGRTSNATPIAVIAAVQSVYLINSTITLNGGGSSDRDGEKLTYAWSLISRPLGSMATIGSPSNPTAGLSPDVGGTYVVQLTVSDGKATGSATIQVRAGTPVSGNIMASTTWTKAMSPIVQVGRVGIAEGVSLTISEGVDVFGENYTLQVAGTLKVDGTPTGKVGLNNVDIRGVGTTSANHLIHIKHSILDGSVYAAGDSGQGNLILEDSRFTLKNYIYLSYPKGEAVIKRNYFARGGISFGVSDTNVVTIQNNSFPGGGWEGGAFSSGVEGWAVYSPARANVNLNTFRSTAGISVSVKYSGAIDAGNNFWSTTDPQVIEKMIWDKNDDLNAPGYINYTPILSGPDPSTPTQ